MAHVMNNFVVNIGKSVEEKIPRVEKHFSFFLDEPNRYSITLNPCSTNEIKYFLDKLDTSKSSGPFSVPTSILKNHKDVLLDPITTLVNKSLNEGTFPTILKSATVIPIHKKNDTKKCANYRSLCFQI